MRLVLFHGNLQEAVLKKIDSIKEGFERLAITEVEPGLSFDLTSQSLFSEKRLVIFENPEIKVFEKIIEEASPELTILVKYSKLLEKSSPILKKAAEGKAEIFAFEEANQNSIFPLLDLLGGKNKKAYSELEKQYSEFGGQYLLVMLAYFLRRMIFLKSSSDFMRSKIESQKKNFSKEKILSLYKELLLTDFKIKQGLLDEKLGVLFLVQKILA